MSKSTLRATAVFVALAASGASLLASAPTAAAVTAVDSAVAALGLGYVRTTEMPVSGDITAVLAAAAKSAGTSAEAHVVHLAGSVTVNATIRPANHVYLVADPGTTVTWRGSHANLVRFASDAGRVTGGIYGGTWDGAGRADSTLIHLGNASVRLADLTVTKADKYGVGAYANSALTLSNVTLTGNYDGVRLDASTLDASRLSSTYNRRNGVQLSNGSSGTITDSVLDHNGQSVKGSTTGKTGHGLGIAASRATVTNTSMSRNKVCGVSLTASANVTISGGNLDSNGRHGLGTEAGTKASITGAKVRSNGYNGVLASGSGTLVRLVQVAVTNAKRSGVSVPSGGAAELTGSTVTGAHGYNISVSGKGRLSLLGGNTVSSSSRHGITVSGRSTIVITGEGNLVTGSHGDGLRLTGSGTTGTISSQSSFVANTSNGIAVVSKARLKMVRCIILQNKKKPIYTRAKGKVTIL